MELDPRPMNEDLDEVVNDPEPRVQPKPRPRGKEKPAIKDSISKKASKPKKKEPVTPKEPWNASKTLVNSLKQSF